ncbi:MAG: hypothetical protein GW938_10155 [Leptospira sp.]|jgi:hypothetical protein|nr:hypothetical protein [Leptospira sp.]NCS93492.1 hypothetical protein [Leptospira sp.]
MRSFICYTLFLFLLAGCESLQTPDENSIDFNEKDQVRFLKYSDKRNKNFLDEIQGFQDQHESFIANFSIRIDTVSPKKDNFNADGRIWFLKETGQVKIQLMDNFFGFIFSEVVANSEQIIVKTSQDKQVHSQRMGDLVVYDPGRKKPITIPFPVIYYYITGEFSKEFQNNPSYVSSETRRVQVKKQDDLFEYFFDSEGLSALEWTSSKKEVKAVAKPVGKRSIPTEALLTKILESDKEVENEKVQVIIQTKLRSIQKKNPSASVFIL